MQSFEDAIRNGKVMIGLANDEQNQLAKNLTLKKAGGLIWTPVCFFPKLYLLKRGETLVFVTFNIIISHIFPENFIKILQVAQKIWRFSLPILAIFIAFYQFFGFSDFSLLQRN